MYNEEYRHTSLIATLLKVWNLAEPMTGRDASARTFEHVFTLDKPRDPDTWPEMAAQPVPEWTMDPEVVGRAVSGLAKALIPGLISHANELGLALPPGLDDPNTEPPPAALVGFLREICLHYFPGLEQQGSPG